MIVTRKLELEDAQAAIAASKQEALQNSWAVSVAVVDSGGALIASERMDGAAPATAAVAHEKARTAAQFRTKTGALEDRLSGRPAVLALPGAVPLRGGVPIVSEGHVVGAIGISGLAPHEDEQVAEAGINALARAL